MDYISKNYESKVHLLAEKHSVGHGLTLCGLTITSGITGGTAYFVGLSDSCKRCERIITKEN